MNTKKLPQAAKEWLMTQRHISEDILGAMQIQYTDDYNQYPWIAIPIFDKQSNLLSYKLRRPPTSKATMKTLNQKGSKAQLYGQNYLTRNTKQVVICEGELDVLALLSLGIEAVCSTTGAATFMSEWLELFPQNIEVCLCFDLDEAGKKGASKIAGLITTNRNDIRIKQIYLPEDLGSGGDISDFISRCKASNVDVVKAINAITGAYNVQKNNHKEFSVNEVSKPLQVMEFEEWSECIQLNFPELHTATEAVLSTVCQLLIKDVTNCFMLVLVDMPASGKTIALNFFDSIKGITYSTDSFTPASFVSNAANVSKEKLNEIDLLPRIRRKMFMVRDMATIFSGRDDDLLKNMGILTRISDGEGMTTDSGVHGQRALEGDYVFMMAAASTPIQPRVWKVMGALGQRLFQVNINSPIKTMSELVAQLQGESYKQKERACNIATTNLLQTLWTQNKKGVLWQKERDSHRGLEHISQTAMILSRLRAQVFTYHEKGLTTGENLSYQQPIIEQPNRLNQTLYNLVRGHAVACGRAYISEDDIPIMLRVAIDSASGERPKIFRELLRLDGRIDTADVMELLNVSDSTARRRMDEFVILGICTEVEVDTAIRFTMALNPEFNWYLSQECKEYLSIHNPVTTLHKSDTV